MTRMMQRLAPLTALALGVAANMVLATDIYVDALSDAATPDGSSEAPFTALKDAVTAANALSGNSTILVRGGAGRVYDIDGAEDLTTVSVSGQQTLPRTVSPVQSFQYASGSKAYPSALNQW